MILSFFTKILDKRVANFFLNAILPSTQIIQLIFWVKNYKKKIYQEKKLDI